MADICVPPDCLNGYDCYWLFFLSIYRYYWIQVSIQRNWKTFSILDTIYCDILWYILLYLSLYLYYIWYRFSFLCKSILLNGKMAKLVLTVVYTVIQLLLLYILLYISYLYSILLQKLCLLPPVYFVDYPVNSDASD